MTKRIKELDFYLEMSGTGFNWELSHKPRYINPWTKAEAEEVKERISQNEKLRERIVDFADIWDGKESLKYGKRLYDMLKELGINDVPEFYKKENIDKFIKEMKKRRNE